MPNDNDFVDPTYAARVRQYEARERRAARSRVNDIDGQQEPGQSQGNTDGLGIAFGVLILLLVIAAQVAK